MRDRCLDFALVKWHEHHRITNLGFVEKVFAQLNSNADLDAQGHAKLRAKLPLRARPMLEIPALCDGTAHAQKLERCLILPVCFSRQFD